MYKNETANHAHDTNVASSKVGVVKPSFAGTEKSSSLNSSQVTLSGTP